MQKNSQLQTPIKTYLQQCLRDGRIMRWTDNSMPLKFFIAPFRFYSKVDEDYKYRKMVLDALEIWEKASGGKVSFQVVPNMAQSQINLDWKRVDRRALGYCHFNMDGQNRLYSAEVQIGISDGIIHQQYMDEDEVFHTIIHEIGHALGLGHSPYDKDIMYTPHKYGITSLSAQDKLTIKWLYRVPFGVTPSEVGSKYGVHGSNIDEIISKIISEKIPSEFEKVKNGINIPKRDLLKEQENIADLKKYNLALQDIKISENIRKLFINQSSDLK